MALAEGEEITLTDLPLDLQELAASLPNRWHTLEEQEKVYIHKVLQATQYHLGDSARILALPRTTLWRKMFCALTQPSGRPWVKTIRQGPASLYSSGWRTTSWVMP